MLNKPILIVDDEAIVRESIRDWLRDAGFEVVTAETGEEALDILGQQDIGVMVLDVRLPGKTGVRILKDVKAIKPQVKTIMISAYPSVELAVEALKLGAVDYLIKPVAPDDLERLIRETLLKC